MKPDSIGYANLRAEMARQEITICSLAKIIGMNRETLSRKLSRKVSIGLNEAFQIAAVFPENNSVLYLFEEAMRKPCNAS